MATMVTGDTLDKAVALLKAIAHHNRIQIVIVLINGEVCVGELAELLGARQPQTSQQLSILKLAGVLKSRRAGNKTYYSLANDGIKRIVKSIIAEI
ncbi:Biofilm growth-associated repressor [subsurface metagenome]